MASPLPENSSSLTVLSSGQNTPKSSPNPDDPPSGQGSVPPPSTTLEGVPQVPFEDQVARLPTFLTTPQTEEDGLYLTAEMPMNKAGFSYIPCAPSPIVSPSPNYPFLRPIPSFPRTSSPSSRVHLSFIDRSPHLRISTDALTCSTPLGFRSGRANIPVRAGAWYCEMIVERGGGEPSGALDGSHVRLGWGRREAKLNSPVGLDGYSYGLRDKTGEKVTLSRPMEYFGKGFGSGDVVGMYISLPEIKTEEDEVVVAVDKGKGREMDVDPSSSSLPSDPLNNTNPPLPPNLDANGASSSSSLPPPPPPPLSSPPRPTPNLAPLQITRHRIPIRYKNQLYFESIDPPVSKEMEALMEPPAPPAPPPPPPTTTATTTANSAPSAPASRKPTTITNKTLPSVDSMRPAIDANPLRPIPILKASKIAFFVNGESPGVAFEDLMDFRPLREAITKKMRGALAEVINGKIYVAKEGTVDDGVMGYYPFISSYGGGRVTFNPGPHYRFPPPDDIDAYLLDPKGEHPRTSIPASATKVKEDPSSTEDISLDVPPPLTEPITTSTDDPSSNPNLSWTPLSSIYPSFHALQEALDERDEQLFIDSYIPDAPNPIPSALDIAARKRKSKDASSEPGSGESSSGGRKGQKGKKGVRVKSRLGLHDGLVDSFSPAPTNSEAGEESSESGSTPAPGGIGAVGGDAARLGGGVRRNAAADELGSEDAMGEEEEDEDDEEMVVVGGEAGAAGGVRAGLSSNPNPNFFTRNPQNGASYPPSTSASILDVPQYQYQQQHQQLQLRQQQQQYQFQQQQFQQQQQRYHSTPFPLPPPNNNPAYFPPAEPLMPNAYSSFPPSSAPQYHSQPQYPPPPPQQYHQQPSFAPPAPARSPAPNANANGLGGNDDEDEDGLGSEDAEGEVEESGDDEEGEGAGAAVGWEGGAIKEHVEETD